MPKSRDPGRRFVSSRQSLADMLMQQEAKAPPIQSNTQGMASLLRQGLAGYMQGEDARERSQAYRTMMEGMTTKPWVNPDTGQVSNAPAGGWAGAQTALAGLGDNEQAMELLPQIGMQRMAQEQATAEKASERAWKEQQLASERTWKEGQQERLLGAQENIAKMKITEAGQQKVFERANTLRDEFNTLTKDFRVVQDATSKIRSTSDTGAGDMSLLYSYVKLLDPGSVVRESEFATAAASGSFGERVQGAVQRILTGERLPKDLRDAFKGEAETIYKVQKSGADRLETKYRELAKRYRLDPEDVIQSYAEPKEGRGEARAPIGGGPAVNLSPVIVDW